MNKQQENKSSFKLGFLNKFIIFIFVLFSINMFNIHWLSPFDFNFEKNFNRKVTYYPEASMCLSDMRKSFDHASKYAKAHKIQLENNSIYIDTLIDDDISNHYKPHHCRYSIKNTLDLDNVTCSVHGSYEDVKKLEVKQISKMKFAEFKEDTIKIVFWFAFFIVLALL